MGRGVALRGRAHRRRVVGRVRHPFHVHQYTSGKSVTWGLNLARTRRRTLEFDTWAFPLDATGRVSQAGELAGLDLAPPAKRSQVIPYALGRVQQDVDSGFQAGVDARFNVTTTTAVYGTVNPDFATVEADVETVNLTRFEVSLPEKRQFLLQRIRTFYSRRIEEILAGAKVLGRQGPWTTSFLTTQTDPIGDFGRANFTVGRAQRDVFGRSSMAVMFDNRNLDGRSNGSASFDTNLFFSRTWGMTAQMVHTWGDFGSGAQAFFVRPSYDSPTGHFHVRYTHLGDRVRDNPGPERESTWIHVVRANQFFTKDLFLRVFFQTNSAIDRKNLQAVFVWRYRPPFGSIQAAYQKGTAPFGQPSNQGHTLFVKATTVF